MPRLAALADRVLDDLTHPGEHEVPERDTLEHLAPLPVDDLALLVHDVVVLDQIAAGVEGVGLHPCLCPFALFRDQPWLDRPLGPAAPHAYHFFFALAAPHAPPGTVPSPEE